MKINPKYNKQVNDSVAECRRTIVNAIIELMKLIGANSGDIVGFGRILFLYQTKDNVSETILADRIIWCTGLNNTTYLLTSLDENFATTDCQLSLSNLQAIYEEVHRIVRNY